MDSGSGLKGVVSGAGIYEEVVKDARVAKKLHGGIAFAEYFQEAHKGEISGILSDFVQYS